MQNIHLGILDALQELILERKNISNYDIIEEIDNDLTILDTETYESGNFNTSHSARRSFLLQFGEFVKYKSFLVDNSHPQGLVINTVTTTGIVIVANAETKKIITYFAPTPSFLIKKFGITDVVILEKAKNNIKTIKDFEKQNKIKLKEI